ncbi:hypothetical protein ACE1TF_15810 [Geomicrobium sp. JSM 1781026]|uniref:hypothetical protein n=1 Tax=Geomicrobium sp. JSM 1781026 TaxID=3344580 RepID=UPI0035C01541
MRRNLVLMCAPVIFLFMACDEQENTNDETIDDGLPTDMPDDFAFSLAYGYEKANEINTYENTYTKDLADYGDITIDFELTDEEMNFVYEQLQQADILNTPGYVAENPCVEPYMENSISITVNDETFVREWPSSNCDSNDERLGMAVHTIHLEVVEPREEYQELPDPVGGYD